MANKAPATTISGKKDNSVSADKLSTIKFKKLIINVMIIISNNQIKTVEILESLTISIMLKGTKAKSGRKLKNDNADLPKTKFTIFPFFIGKVNNGLTLNTGSF